MIVDLYPNGDKTQIKPEDIVFDYKDYSIHHNGKSFGSSNFIYSNEKRIPEPIGGFEAGSSISGLTLKQFIDTLLYPKVKPVVTFNTKFTPSIPSAFKYVEKENVLIAQKGLTGVFDVSSSIAINDYALSQCELIISSKSKTYFDKQLTPPFKESFTLEDKLTETITVSLYLAYTTGESLTEEFYVVPGLEIYEGSDITKFKTLSDASKIDLFPLDVNHSFDAQYKVAIDANKTTPYLLIPADFFLRYEILDSNGFDLTSLLKKTSTVELEVSEGNPQQFYLFSFPYICTLDSVLFKVFTKS